MNKTEPVREREERQDLRSFVVRLFGSSEMTDFGSLEVTNFGGGSGSGEAGGAARGGVRNFQTLGHCGFHTAELRKSETSRVPKWTSS